MKIFSSKKRVAAIGVVTAATLVGGGMAYAYWTTIGEGDGTAQTAVGALEYGVDISDPIAPFDLPLAPGEGEQLVQVTVTNPEPGVRRLTNVVVSIAEANGDPWSVTVGPDTCDATDFTLNTEAAGAPVDLVGSFLDLDGGETSDPLDVTIKMVNKAEPQDACKNLPVPLYASVS